VPSNLLVLDEPTNDLGVETLELLEEKLIDYGGTVLVVSHDRTFVDNVVTSTIAFVADGRFIEHAGGYSDWLSAERAADVVRRSPIGDSEAKTDRRKVKTPSARKLTFKERRELEVLPARIEELEAEQHEVQASLADPAFYAGGDGAAVAAARDRLAALEVELEAAYVRWQALEEIEGS
jgi:ABC transport system ATP-binding/permease protein